MAFRQFYSRGAFVAVLGIFIVAAIPAVRSAEKRVSPGLATRLVGTWRLVEDIDSDASGKITYPLGEHPVGYFVYDPTGHLSVQIMRIPTRSPFASGKDDEGTNEEVRSAYEGYVAYFGTYRVDEKNSVVIHVVEGSLRPSYTGTEQPRPFKLDGDTLVIEGLNPHGHFYRELHRVK